MQKFFNDISKWRYDLEAQSIDSSNTGDTVALITYVQFLKKQIKSSQEQVNISYIIYIFLKDILGVYV